MGLTMQHAAAVVVPIATGFVLNFVGYQIPFLIASGFACLTFLVTRRLDPASQKTERRLREEAAYASPIPPPTVPTPVTGAPLEQRPAGLVGDATTVTD